MGYSYQPYQWCSTQHLIQTETPFNLEHLIIVGTLPTPTITLKIFFNSAMDYGPFTRLKALLLDSVGWGVATQERVAGPFSKVLKL